MTRRSFFGLIAAGLAAAADPERLIWEPGRKLISIPATTSLQLSLDEFRERYLKPAMEQMGRELDKAIAEALQHGTGYLRITSTATCPPDLYVQVAVPKRHGLSGTTFL